MVLQCLRLRLDRALCEASRSHLLLQGGKHKHNKEIHRRRSQDVAGAPGHGSEEKLGGHAARQMCFNAPRSQPTNCNHKSRESGGLRFWIVKITIWRLGFTRCKLSAIQLANIGQVGTNKLQPPCSDHKSKKRNQLEFPEGKSALGLTERVPTVSQL